MTLEELQTNYIEVDKVFVSKEILQTYFVCDYSACKGACCIGDISDIKYMTAPQLDEFDKKSLEMNYQIFSPLMTSAAREFVEQNSLSTSESRLPIIIENHKFYCAFCHFDKSGSYLCAIEKKHDEGCYSYRKPHLCALAPLRVNIIKGHLHDGYKILYLNTYNCKEESFKKGRDLGIKIYQFLKDGIIESFGQEFYDHLESIGKDM